MYLTTTLHFTRTNSVEIDVASYKFNNEEITVRIEHNKKSSQRRKSNTRILIRF